MELRERLDPEWAAKHRRHGAAIHDHDRGVSYYATVDPDRLELDYLSVEAHGHIDENVMRRVPVQRIRREVVRHYLAQQKAEAEKPGSFLFTPPGGLTDTRSKGQAPSLEEVADLVNSRNFDRHALAAHFARSVRTVDRWLTQARKAGLIQSSEPGQDQP